MKTLLKFLFGLGLLFALTLSAQAQTSDSLRSIPANALKAKMTVTADRTATLNGKSYTLAVGCLIYDEKNLIVLTQSLMNNTYLVRVQLNDQQEVQKVWILTPAESQVSVAWLGGWSFWRRLLSL